MRLNYIFIYKTISINAMYVAYTRARAFSVLSIIMLPPSPLSINSPLQSVTKVKMGERCTGLNCNHAGLGFYGSLF